MLMKPKYCCEYCGREFYKHDKAVEHEKTCAAKKMAEAFAEKHWRKMAEEGERKIAEGARKHRLAQELAEAAAAKKAAAPKKANGVKKAIAKVAKRKGKTYRGSKTKTLEQQLAEMEEDQTLETVGRAVFGREFLKMPKPWQKQLDPRGKKKPKATGRPQKYKTEEERKAAKAKQDSEREQHRPERTRDRTYRNKNKN